LSQRIKKVARSDLKPIAGPKPFSCPVEIVAEGEDVGWSGIFFDSRRMTPANCLSASGGAAPWTLQNAISPATTIFLVLLGVGFL
jgi:hypothetical protein